ncbi:MAG: hypothetical protein ABR526_11765, partial [Chthoniobacterales bacterium]
TDGLEIRCSIRLSYGRSVRLTLNSPAPGVEKPVDLAARFPDLARRESDASLRDVETGSRAKRDLLCRVRTREFYAS